MNYVNSRYAPVKATIVQSPMKIHFEEFKILEVGDLEDQVSHTLFGLKRYQIRYIFVCIYICFAIANS